MVSVTTGLLRRWRVTSALVLALAWPPSTFAHTFLDHATPRADSAVRESPASIKLWLSEALEPAFSTVEVRDKTSQRIDKADPRVDAANPKLLQVSLPRLAAGKYRVSWRVLSVDTHVDKGEFSFEVKP